MPHFAVTYTYADRPGDLDAHRPEHRAFLRGLYSSGDLVASGPYAGPSDGTPGALLILTGADAAAVERLLDDDPFAGAGLIANRSIREWNPVVGSLATE